jgi:1-acyl-sn-glycerol-3-phosphate acyltransferase
MEWIHKIRTLFIIAAIVVMTIALGCFVIILAFFSRSGNTAHRVARFWGKFILFISGIKVEVKGVSNVDAARPCVFMANHQGNFDIPVLLGCLPFQFRWLAKAELFRIPIFGRAMRGCGYISIDRFNRSSAFDSIARAAETIRSGVNVMIFPEGTRSLDGKIRPFKKGGFVLTVDAGVPIIPVIIHGTYFIMPKKKLLVRPGPVLLEILEPVETSGYTRENKDALMEEIRSKICTAFGKAKGGHKFC